MSEKNSPTSWFLRPQNTDVPKLRLFCFPYAGGNAHLFNQWAKFLPSGIEVCSVSMPGRGSRINETPLREISEAVERLTEKIVELDDKPFAFFGHSLGATIAFEITRKLAKSKQKTPIYLFVSGRSAPQTIEKVEKTYHLSDTEFIESVRTLGGTPQELIDNRELMELIVPGLKADFQMVQNYQFNFDSPISCPISAFGGLSDNFVSRENLNAWSELTSAKFSAKFLEGDHFFINRQAQNITKIVAETLIPFQSK